jgi:diguanylate cyclase (GGDEF)-like protein
MNSSTGTLRFTVAEKTRLAFPAILSGWVLNIVLMINSYFVFIPGAGKSLSFTVGCLGIFLIILMHLLTFGSLKNYPILKWAISLLNGILLGSLLLLSLNFRVSYIYLAILVMINTIVTGRWPTYLMALAAVVSFQLPVLAGISRFNLSDSALIILAVSLMSIAISEPVTYLHFTLATRDRRIEVLNKIARSLSSSIEIHQVLSLVSSAIQNTLDADTYYVGLLQPDGIHLELFYDDGEFFPPTKLDLNNTLAGWIVTHQQSLLLKNLQKETPALGFLPSVVGQPHQSKSWMGTLLESGNKILGIVAVASYRLHAFSPADLELLENFAQQASMAIDNAVHHSEVELQSKSDSLTGALNHSHFLKELEEQAIDCQVSRQQISLVMLDIDHFKQYNDTYGHLVGDEVLTQLTRVIRLHIKSTDLLGRWGGEEFVIALLHTRAGQANLVAERIRQSLNQINLSGRQGQKIPAPTVSQGFAIYPDEANEIFALIDLADQRLYVAKERGRDQVEPNLLVR